MATTLITRRDADRVYSLLPVLYRDADVEQGYPLKALLNLVGEQAELLHADVEQLWHNFFIETCARWAIPYIGELVANNLLHDVDPADAARTAESLFLDVAGPNLRPPPVIRRRADVARTIYYRRRKGRLSMLEELARDVTGWAAHAVEFFEQLNWTQHMNHLRPASLDAPDVRKVGVGDRVQGPFDQTSHTVDVRPINQTDGWFNIRNIGLFLWRLRSYPVQRVPARQIGGGGSWRYTFSSLGDSRPLFSAWLREGDEAGLTTERHAPAPIRSSAFFEDLERFAARTPPPPLPNHTDYYGDPTGHPDWSFAVFENGVLVPPGKITCANLSNWNAFPQPDNDKVAIDVRRGRFIVGKQRPAKQITVAYHYGFSADLGGGPYDRTRWLAREAAGQQRFTVTNTSVLTLDKAIDAWAALPAPRPDTVITIRESGTYPLSRTLTLDGGGWLTIEADSGVRAHVQPAGGVIQVGPAGASSGSVLTLSGLLVEGAVAVGQDLKRLRLLHTTLIPGRSIAEGTAIPGGASVTVVEQAGTTPLNAGLQVEIAFSITGPLRIPAHAAGLWVLDSIIDGTAVRGSPRIAAIADASGKNGPPATIERATILGASFFHRVPLASEAIFTDPVTVARQQEGCVRFSFVPPTSVTPRQYRCQPALEISAHPELPEASILAWLRPRFTSRDYAHAAYAQLALVTPRQIVSGAADGTEMGAFNHLKQPQRETNLRVRLQEYLPFGLEAGLIYVT